MQLAECTTLDDEAECAVRCGGMRVEGGEQRMRAMLGAVQYRNSRCNVGQARLQVETRLEELERIQSKERKLVARDNIAHLIDAQRAVVLVAMQYRDNYLREKNAEFLTHQPSAGVAGTDAWENKTQEAAALLARTFQEFARLTQNGRR